MAAARRRLRQLAGKPRVMAVGAAPVVLAGLASGIVATHSDSSPGDATVVVKRGTVIAAATAEGNVQSPEEVDLGFKTGGRIVHVAVRDGQRVKRGELLASVENRSQQARLASSISDLASTRARLAQTRTGLTPIEHAEQARLAEQSRVALSNARRDLVRSRVTGEEVDLRIAQVRAAQQHAETAGLRRRYKQKLAKRDADAQRLEDALERLRRAASRDTTEFDTDTDQEETCSTPPCDSTSHSEYSSQPRLNRAQQDVDVYTVRLNVDNQDVEHAHNALLQAVADEKSFDIQLDDRRTALRNQRRIWSSGFDELLAARSQLHVTLAQNRVGAQVKAADVAAATANVAQAMSAVAARRQELSDTELRAPSDGVIGHVDAKVGQVVGPSLAEGLIPSPTQTPQTQRPNTGSARAHSTASQAPPAAGPIGDISGAQPSAPLVTFSPTPGQLVKVNVAEADANAVRPGLPGVVTADALPGKRFPVHVVSVDPIATVVNNVVTYRVTLAVDFLAPQLKPGMTTTAHITVARRSNAVMVPRTAVRSPAGAAPTVVVVSRDSKPEPRMVTTGLQNDSHVEILGGIGPGERILRALSAPPAG